MGNMFGTSSTPPAITTAFSDEVFSTGFNPEDEVNNPAFASEQTEESDVVDEEQEQNWFDQEQPTASQQNAQPQQEEYSCENCGSAISEKVYGYSIDKFGRPLCVKCQRGAH